ncbi:cytidine deaminase [Falsiroseomonas sp.]|uniref:cytidine deaminase n=1 Tax=Falsiroseomonas sp. TaxID=2870721 RepID=UPI003F713F14
MDLIDDDALMAKAEAARGFAHAPYSRFRVGAALLADGGAVITGCNVENASYGATICAERTAVVAAVAAGHRRFTAIAIAGPAGIALGPCGMCRQVLSEFAPDGALRVLTRDAAGAIRATTIGQLLPAAFGATDLAGSTPE